MEESFLGGRHDIDIRFEKFLPFHEIFETSSFFISINRPQELHFVDEKAFVIPHYNKYLDIANQIVWLL